MPYTSSYTSSLPGSVLVKRAPDLYPVLSSTMQYRTGVVVSVLCQSKFSGLRLRVDESNKKRLPNTSMYN